jgi:hypothetical protein
VAPRHLCPAEARRYPGCHQLRFVTSSSSVSPRRFMMSLRFGSSSGAFTTWKTGERRDVSGYVRLWYFLLVARFARVIALDTPHHVQPSLATNVSGSVGLTP